MNTGTSSIGARLKILGYANYQEYLKSAHWQEFRRRFFRESAVAKKLRLKFGELRCQFCAKSAVLHLHHKTYKRMGAEWLSDVVLICEQCHTASHNRHRSNPRKGLWAATKRVGKGARKKPKPHMVKNKRFR